MAYEVLRAEIAKDPSHVYFDRLEREEPTIAWIDWAARFYRHSEATSTITGYSLDICRFKDSIKPKTLTEVIEELKPHKDAAGNEVNVNGLVYKYLDKFATWCHDQGYKPHTTSNAVRTVKRTLQYFDIDIDDHKFKDKVSLPQAQHMLDEYPKNAEIIKIHTAMPSLKLRGFFETMLDTGLEPIDAIELRPKHIKFDESPVRIFKLREKTGERIETYISENTAATLKQLAQTKKPDEPLFVKTISKVSVHNMRIQYNVALAKAGYGTLINYKTGQYAKVDKIEGHSFGKYHLKVYKKRWFSLAISAGVPTYVAQAMLGRKQYLDEYFRLAIETRQDYARKILKAVNIYATEKSKTEIAAEVTKMLGLDSVTSEQISKLRDALQALMTMEPDQIKEVLKR